MALVPHRTAAIPTTLLSRGSLTIVTLIDRRPSAPSLAQEWLFQTELEDLLYTAAITHGTVGAFYRLLKRSVAGGMALSLRRTSVTSGLVTDGEFDALKAFLHSGVRVFTLLPIDAVARAMATYGPTPASEALMDALGLPRPAAWEDTVGGAEAMDEEGEEDEGEEEEGEEEEEEEEEDEGEEDEGADESGSGGGDSADGSGSADESGGGGSNAHGGSSDDGSGSSLSGGSGSSRSRSHHDDECPATEDDADPADDGAPVARRRRPTLAVSASLESQLQAFARWRVSTVNRQRAGTAVASVTAADDRRSVLHFFAWLQHARGVKTPSFSLFSSPQMGATVQAFIREKTACCKYSRVANVVGSLVAASRFTHAMLKAQAAPEVVVSAVPLEEMAALHAQCLGEARQAAKFDLVKPPTAWLDWDACQRARLRAEHVLAACDDNDAQEQLALIRVCCLLVLLTALPPDRVGVYRRLRLGSTLKMLDGVSYQIDLSERGAHKTCACHSPLQLTARVISSHTVREAGGGAGRPTCDHMRAIVSSSTAAIFGPSRTTVTAAVAERIHSLVTRDALVVGEYLFHASNDRRTALSPSAWTRFVKTAFRSHSGVALSPKDCRARYRNGAAHPRNHAPPPTRRVAQSATIECRMRQLHNVPARR